MQLVLRHQHGVWHGVIALAIKTGACASNWYQDQYEATSVLSPIRNTIVLQVECVYSKVYMRTDRVAHWAH